MLIVRESKPSLLFVVYPYAAQLKLFGVLGTPSLELEPPPELAGW